ncbi:DUF802 domain-containing protein [Pandoraea nosoerga]|uniref:DUF802 domain-containing protein n=1 Tax=Pandoraea nosoerga TaxID=2508296 RepID=A0A5E4T6B5_9BURK|nr:DUF802 domain-containing protein [Pandoraea nosoerga]MBN4664269.1 DUF802 domain-containing protein [Pandoraea nosoerga]MBN4675836.1 DUF802 domain-containing protein [Pandoraea nosoerga]MBN4679357.1 DUF802 domain-containing protein [Pandoraea nosoerga]MBN4743646.1 DUF802 domain-containing protein [Pandoraea nosoerga]VVD83001.1 hypothetical protein PNO31109_01202 [Pandoraea nosoerga]
MTRYLVDLVAFVAGLAVVGWIAIGYAGTNTLALAIALLIAAVYLIGALELKRFHQSTCALARAVAGLHATPASLPAWLDTLPAGLRNAVRLRVEGERVGLPGPALTPYLVGLLVLLGMLGTFLGMAATLRGTGLALEGATDLEAIRASLASPVKGLGFAFGTSVAGVATSAMLGLLAALARKERAHAVQALDARIATTLRPFSQQHQRETTLQLLAQQATAMPALVERLQEMMAAMERHGQTLGERLVASQDALHAKTGASYAQLTDAMQQYLKDSVATTASAAGAAIRPAVEATMASLARETASWQQTVCAAMQDRMDGLSDRFEATTTRVANVWNASLDAQLRANESLATDLRAALGEFTQTFDTRSAKLLDEVAARLESATDHVSAAHAGVAKRWEASLAAQQATSDTLARDLAESLAQFAQTFETRSAGLLADVTSRLDNATGSIATAQTTVAQAWEQALAQQQRSHAALTQDLGAALERFAQTFEARANALLADVATQLDAASGSVSGAHERVAQAWDRSIAQQKQANEALNAELAGALARFAETFEQRSAQWLQSVCARIDSTSESVAQTWREAIAEHTRTSERLADGNQQLIAATTSAFNDHSASLMQALSAANAAHHDATAERETQRLSAWTQTLEGTLATLRAEWQKVGEHAASQQQAICDALARAALEMSEQTRANANDTIAEISRLVQTASEAPKAAAEIIGELRQKLSESMVRDNAMLEERSRLLDTLGTLLDTVKHAGNEQRAAVDELVTTSARLLERAGANLGEAIAAQTDKLAAASAQVAGSAIEIASLGDAFGAAVQSFGESNAQLLEHLQRIEAALDKSMARSDEQLGYYVAQAREVVELSVLSQKQILENLQDLAQTRAQPGSVAA